jgi:hypothetical protein
LQPGAVLKFRAGAVGWADVLYHDEICSFGVAVCNGCLTPKHIFKSHTKSEKAKGVELKCVAERKVV